MQVFSIALAFLLLLSVVSINDTSLIDYLRRVFFYLYHDIFRCTQLKAGNQKLGGTSQEHESRKTFLHL